MELVDRETEEKLLGEIAGCSSYQDAADVRLDVDRLNITPEVFHFSDTRAVFEVMLSRLREGEPCDVVHIRDAILKLPISTTSNTHTTVGWLLTAQAGGMGTLSIAKAWVRDLKELAARRRVKQLAVDLQLRAGDPTMEMSSALGWLSAQMNGLVSGAYSRVQRLDTKLDLVAQQIAEVGTDSRKGVVKTGIDVWDTNVGGLFPTLTVIGGHPSRGKSGLAASFMLGLARQQKSGLIFSLEDPAEWILYRLLADASRVSGFFMRTRPLTAEQQEAVGLVWEEIRALAKFIMFDERSRLTPMQLVAAARDAILTEKAQWIIADHAGEFSYPQLRKGERADMDIAEGLMDLRALAKEHRVPVVLLSQLTGSSKPPHTMLDFKNTSVFAEAARVAAIVWTKDGAPLDVTVSLLKNTFGKRDFDMKFRLDPTSGLLIEPPNPTMPVGEQKDLL
jgi:replicative DNA helicase